MHETPDGLPPSRAAIVQRLARRGVHDFGRPVQWQVNAHTADRSFVLRFYRIEANDGAWSGAPP
jgi:hypothetical protein